MLGPLCDESVIATLRMLARVSHARRDALRCPHPSYTLPGLCGNEAAPLFIGSAWVAWGSPYRCWLLTVTTLSEGFREGVSDYSWAAVPVGRVVTGSE